MPGSVEGHPLREAPVDMRLNRRGATLPLSVIVLALMAVAVAITHARISSERHMELSTFTNRFELVLSDGVKSRAHQTFLQ
jgi:hypothetical protein